MELNINDLSNENFDMGFDNNIDLTSINLDIPVTQYNNNKMNVIKQNIPNNSFEPKSILKNTNANTNTIPTVIPILNASAAPTPTNFGANAQSSSTSVGVGGGGGGNGNFSSFSSMKVR
jgi:hypothetical protein